MRRFDHRAAPARGDPPAPGRRSARHRWHRRHQAEAQGMPIDRTERLRWPATTTQGPATGPTMRRPTFRNAGRFLVACLALGAATARADEEPQYNRDVRPILADACFRCHGPGVKKAGLRLDRRESALAATES